jgi:DNA-binding SARP family transcriptional activator
MALQGQKRLSLRLLGPPEVSLRGLSLRFGIKKQLAKKQLALLCYLAAEDGRRHQRRGLAELLWPRSDERHARTDLRSVLSRLRQSLEDDGRLLLIDGDLLGVEPTQVELDTEALETAVSLARRETSPAGASSAAAAAVGRRELIGRLRGDLGFYRGEFMEGFSIEDAPEFELWVEGERTKWRALFGELCERLSRLEAEEGLIAEAIATARLWARHAPLEEAAHRRLMELLSSVGESERALLAYENFKNALGRELGMEPSPPLQELAARLHEEVQERASLGTSLARFSEDAPTTGLPSYLEAPLVGRQEEFGALVSEYQAVSMGQTRAVAILGEAGIGKTRLAEEFLGWARASGADVLKGGTSEAAGLPYGPLIEAIRSRIERERAPDDLLEDVWLSELSSLLPELKERYPDLDSPLSVERETAKGALFEAIARLVEAMASSAPVALFLDDLQWGDSATLEVMDYAGKRWAEQGAAVLVLIAARTEEPEANSAFERWLLSLGRRLPLRSLAPGTLAKEDVEVLLRGLANAGSSNAGSSSKPPDGALEEVGGSNEADPRLERLGEWLAVETEGQPFYLVETIKVLFEEGMLLIRNRADGETVVDVGPALRAERSAVRGLLPKSVREVIHVRLSRLSPAGSQLLGAGAVLERGFDFETLVSVADLGEAEGLRGLDELIERHLLREEAAARDEEDEPLLHPSPTYSFTQEKIRQVAYTEAGPTRRRLLHRRAFELLEEGGASSPPAQLAHHALAGGLAEPAFRYSVAAGDQAVEVFAARDAIEHYQRAQDLLAEAEQTGGGQPTERSILDLEHLYTRLGRAYDMASEREKARAAYEALLAVGRELGDARLEVLSLNLLAVFDYHQGDDRKVRALLEEARRMAEDAGLEEALVEIECNMAEVMAIHPRDYEHSGPLARKALASARTLGRPDLVARALATLARVEVFAGRFEEAAAYAEEGAQLSRELADRPEPRTELPPTITPAMGLSASWRTGNRVREIHCLTNLAYALILQGRPQEGIAIGREAQAISGGLPERIEAVSTWAVRVGLMEIGEYEEVLEHCLRGTELARKTQNVFLLWVNLEHLGWAYEALLDLEKARRIYEEGLELRGALGSQYEVFTSIRLCAVTTLSGDWEEAYVYAKKVHEDRPSFNVLDIFYLHHVVEALLQGGDESSAREEVGRFAERAEANERERVPYLRSLAVLSESEGDTKTAIEHLREAHTLVRKIGLQGELWQIQSRLGELHERRGEDAEAHKAFSLAAQTLRELAQKIRDEELRERFLSAPQARRVLGHTS